MNKSEYLYNAKVMNIVDGDTIDVIIDLGFHIHFNERVRLNGLDTCEMNSPDPEKRLLAREAKEFLIQRLMFKNVTLRTFKKDKYGRFLADVFPAGDHQSINEVMLEKKLAVSYSGGKREI